MTFHASPQVGNVGHEHNSKPLAQTSIRVKEYDRMKLQDLYLLAQAGSENAANDPIPKDGTGTFDTDPTSILDSIDNL